MQTKLSVNLNKVALLRNQRDVGYPSVVGFARTVLAAGAHGVTIHPRPDERHIRQSDAYELGELLAGEYPDDIEFNIEGNPTDDFLALVHRIRPTQVTLVPDAPDQATSDHGWPLEDEAEQVRAILSDLKAGGMRTALFVDPDRDVIARAAEIGADRIELYTEPYAVAHANGDYQASLKTYSECASHAVASNLVVNAGHDLNLENLPPFRQALPALAEVSIGHAITADALDVGFSAAVKAYLDALKG
ncbi:MAG: pyridoxine 5'-phosphate synthase [Pseudomonadota bacterium]